MFDTCISLLQGLIDSLHCLRSSYFGFLKNEVLAEFKTKFK